MAFKQLISSDQLADDLGLSKTTPPTWRALRKGPPWIKVGKAVFYDQADVEKWLQSQRRDPAKLKRSGAATEGAAA